MDALRDSESGDINTLDTLYNEVAVCCVSSHINCLCCLVLQSTVFHTKAPVWCFQATVG